MLSRAKSPHFDINTVPSAGAGWKINVPERVEQLRTYLRENTYPAQQKNIIAVIEMDERKELPKPNTHRVCLQDGKVIESRVDNWLKMEEPVWTEVLVCLRQCTPLSTTNLSNLWMYSHRRWPRGIADDSTYYHHYHYCFRY